MVSRFVTAVAIAAVIAAARPALADNGAVPAMPPPSSTPAPSGSRAVSRRAGVALLIVGGVLGLASSYFIVRARQERDSLNPDDPTADAAYGTLLAVPALVSLTVGVALLIPNDAGPNSNSPNNHPGLVQLPRGLTMRFSF